MKKYCFLSFLVIAFGCKKENSPGNTMLLRIEADNKVYQSFEYSNGLLVKEKYFGHCTSNPIDEFSYSYQDGKLARLDMTMRSFYSSTVVACDPSSGVKSDQQFEYDNAGRIRKVVRSTSYTVFEFNDRGLVQKQVLYLPNNTAVDSSSFKYDQRGNIIEQTDSQGNTGYYTYDNKKNPFYQMKQRPDWISPFNTSPGNVIKATGAHSFERKINGYRNEFPVSVLESTNGVTYSYIY